MWQQQQKMRTQKKANPFEMVTSSLPPGHLSQPKTQKQIKLKNGKPVSASKLRPEPVPQQKIKVIDKRSLCVETLADGYVQSFVDFFYLTHRPDPTPDPYGLNGQKEIDVPVDDMVKIKEGLIEAEDARRTTDKVDVVYRNYSKLAEHYQSESDHKTGIYFYEKCLEIARMTNDAPGEMKANHKLGLAYEAQSNFEKATECHEKHLSIAQHVGSTPDATEQQELAREQLKKAYFSYAQQLQAAGNLEEAAKLFKKCISTARTVRDVKVEGLASYSLGKVQVELGGDANCASGMGHLQHYLKICERERDIEGQGQAHSALAVARQGLGQTEQALDHLKKFHDTAKQTTNLAAQSKACYSIGAIYNTDKRFNKAVTYFQQNYELCRKMAADKSGTLKVVDRARVSLGMAKGNQKLNKFIYVINSDMHSLLHWKNARQDIQ